MSEQSDVETDNGPSAKELITGVVLFAALGAGIGTWVEISNIHEAKGKIITLDTCSETYPSEDTISDDLAKCLHDGVPGGKEIDGDDTIKEGQPITYVASLRQHEVEQSRFEVGTVAEWTIGVPVVVGGLTLFFG